MKRIIFLPLFLFLFGCASTQEITRLEERIITLEGQLDELDGRIINNVTALEKINADLSQMNFNATNINSDEQTNSTSTKKENSVNLNPNQCKAITKAGTQCKRTTKEGSDYCWQHQSYNKSVTKEKSSSYSNDKTIHTGPRGGQYYINSKGNKTYIKKKK